MSLNYDKLKQKGHNGDSFWTSYADLATVLTVIFLAMYAVATLRTTTVSVAEHLTNRAAQQQIDELKAQIQAYDVLKEEYLQKGASEAERQMYDSLLGQMKLMEQEATSEKEEHLREAAEEDRKAKGLNQYQAKIKNIIIANMLAQKSLKGRDAIIAQKSKSIEELRRDVKSREVQLQQNNQQIDQIQTQLKKSIVSLKAAYRSKARSRKKMEAKIAALKAESQQKISALRNQNQAVSGELENAKTLIGQKSQELQAKESALAEKQATVEQLAQEKAKAEAQLAAEEKQYAQTVQDLKAQHEVTLAQERAQYQARLKSQQMSAQQKIDAERAYLAQVESEKNAYDAKLKDLAKTLEGTKAQVSAKQQELEGTRAQVSQKEQQIAEKQRQIAQSQQQIAEQQHELDGTRALVNQKERQIAQNQQQIAETQEQIAAKQKQIANAERELADAQRDSAAMDAKYRSQVAALEAEKGKILGELGDKERGYQAAIDKLQGDFRSQLEGEKKAFEDGLAKEKLTEGELQAKQAAYRAQVDAERAGYESKMHQLSGQLADTQKAISAKESQYRYSMGQLQNANRGLERELASVRAREQAQRLLASRIKENFKRAGVDANVDPRTGEVTLNFGEEYFDYGSSKVKNGMQQILQKAIPVYAQSILEDPAIAKKISSVEISGFASPTYKGKYVDPRDLSPEVRKAVNYNLDLSYQRAKSIFEYVFDQDRMKYKHQRELLALSKVTGQGYLRAQGASTSGLTDEQYCNRYDCTKSQRVLIKFNFGDK